MLVGVVRNRNAFLVSVVAAGIVAWGAVVTVQRAQPVDCADVVMQSVMGPNENAARAAFQCSTLPISRIGEDGFVRANANFTPADHFVRAGQASGVGEDYVFYVLYFSDASHNSWYVATVRDGKVARLD